jgi:DNA-binding NtrC family response regulator
MMSGHGTIETAVEATRIGAIDFLEKPIALQKLLGTVKRVLRFSEARTVKPLSIGGIGRSSVLADLRKRLAQLEAVNAAVLLRGEQGVMPELYAHLLQRPNSPWINSAQTLLDGSQDVLQQSAGGVLFIDELAALSKAQQKHLSFVVARSEKHQVRLISFTAEEPRHLVESRGFDPALMHALSAVVVSLPALREHPEDIPEIAGLMLAHLVEARFCAPRNFSTAALNLLRNFDWPGNLQDLAAAVRTLAATALDEEIGAAQVESVLPQFKPAAKGIDVPLDMPLRDAREAFERAYFEHHLALENGSIARVAEKCGLERTHLYRKLKALGIHTGRREE